MIKVNYDKETTLVKGYYPDTIKYKSIPEPYIEIDSKDQVNDKQMCVIDGVYREYIKTEKQIAEEVRSAKIAEIKSEAERLINKKYTDRKQLKILRSGNTNDILDMNTFIENIISISHKLERDIEELPVCELENFNINFNKNDKKNNI